MFWSTVGEIVLYLDEGFGTWPGGLVRTASCTDVLFLVTTC